MKILSNKKWIKIPVILFLFFGTHRICHKLTDGFQIRKIISTHPVHPKWASSPLSPKEQEEVEKLLDQPFFFLAKGGQSYAFISKDEKVVLKVFKQHHMRPHFWLRSLSLPEFLEPVRRNFLRSREKKRNMLYRGYLLAHENLKEETGLLFLHLNKSPDWHKSCTLVDKLGIMHMIDLGETEFLLQKKALLVYPTLDHLVQQGETEKVKQHISSLLSLILERCKKEIMDKDAVINRNFGYIEGKAIIIDAGCFKKNTLLALPLAYKKQFHKEAMKFKHWIAKHHPTYLSYTNEQIDSLEANR